MGADVVGAGEATTDPDPSRTPVKLSSAGSRKPQHDRELHDQVTPPSGLRRCGGERTIEARVPNLLNWAMAQFIG